MPSRNISGSGGKVGKTARKGPVLTNPSAPSPRPRHTTTKPQGAEFSPEKRQQWVAEAAYFIAEHRGFAPGAELDDWLQAEAEIERRLVAAGIDVPAVN